MAEEFIRVGKITGQFGVRGWMKVFSFTEPRNNILSYRPLYLEREGQWLETDVINGRKQGKGIIISLDNITSPEQVIPLIGTQLAIKKSQLAALEQDEYYWSQLIGLSVLNLAGKNLGEVTNLIETGASDVLVVTDRDTKAEYLIPFVINEIVYRVDIVGQTIEVDWQADY